MDILTPFHKKLIYKLSDKYAKLLIANIFLRMSSIIKLLRHPYIRPSIMTEKTKGVWSFIGCGIVTTLTLSYIIEDNKKYNLKYHSNKKS